MMLEIIAFLEVVMKSGMFGRTFIINFPLTPNVSGLGYVSTVLAYTMPVKQMGHQVTAMGTLPTSSLTIS